MKKKVLIIGGSIFMLCAGAGYHVGRSRSPDYDASDAPFIYSARNTQSRVLSDGSVELYLPFKRFYYTFSRQSPRPVKHRDVDAAAHYSMPTVDSREEWAKYFDIGGPLGGGGVVVGSLIKSTTSSTLNWRDRIIIGGAAVFGFGVGFWMGYRDEPSEQFFQRLESDEALWKDLYAKHTAWRPKGIIVLPPQLRPRKLS